MAESHVDRLHSESISLLKLLDDAQEISLLSTADDSFRKLLLLSAASYFERKMTDCVIAFVDKSTGHNLLVVSLVKTKAITRQYHTWFDWEQPNANQFFRLFGEEFLIYMKAVVRENVDIADAIKAFLEVGRDRNRLIHQDFGSFSLEKTSAEIYTLYIKALLFVEKFPQTLDSFLAEHSPAVT